MHDVLYLKEKTEKHIDDINNSNNSKRSAVHIFGMMTYIYLNWHLLIWSEQLLKVTKRLFFEEWKRKGNHTRINPGKFYVESTFKNY